jgi:sulfonate transport system substrate-binding protein
MAAGLIGAGVRAQSAQPLKELRLDYADYSPTSLVPNRFGWLEEDFGKDGVPVKWTLSAGSNRALEYLSANSIDIGSSASLAALLAKANGMPIRTPCIFSRPEWTALVVPTIRRSGRCPT